MVTYVCVTKAHKQVESNTDGSQHDCESDVEDSDPTYEPDNSSCYSDSDASDKIATNFRVPQSNPAVTETASPDHRENADTLISSEISSSSASTHTWVGRSGKRRARPCFYCEKYVKTLTRHLSTVHRDKPDVQAAMKLPSKKRNAAFNQLKRDGIMQHNKQQMGLEQPQLERERLGKEGPVVFCGKCSGVFSRKCFYKHKKNCRSRDELLQPTAIPSSFIAVSCHVAENFKVDILSRFIGDRVGILCQTDETLVNVGQKLYFKVKAKRDKKTEVRRTVCVICEDLQTCLFALRKSVARMELIMLK